LKDNERIRVSAFILSQNINERSGLSALFPKTVRTVGIKMDKEISDSGSVKGISFLITGVM
jgi:hypothetical protein